MQSPLPANESARLKALRRYHILDSEAEQAYDDITYLASYICDTPMALLTLVDEQRQWFKSKVGLSIKETPRKIAFCAYTILQPDSLLVVPDAYQDERFRDNPLVQQEPHIRFYAGAPLVTQEDGALGTLCVLDRKPRKLTDEQTKALKALARQAMAQLELRQLVLTYQQIESELQQANERLSTQARTDSLTGLNNKGAFDERLAEEIDRAHRYQLPLSLILLDIDHFKEYNDTYGHPAGDTVMEQVARILQEQARPGDFIARYGGEEFAVILTNTSSLGAYVVAERLRHAIHEAPWPQRLVTGSLGVSTLSAVISESAQLVLAADQALYEAKRQGRNRVVAASTR
jgi:diguanylate cyclase (GGDEF)-like protein